MQETTALSIAASLAKIAQSLEIISRDISKVGLSHQELVTALYHTKDEVSNLKRSYKGTGPG